MRSVVDTRSQQIATRIQAKPGIANVRFAPGGRWGFVFNAKENVVYVVDASTNRLAHTITVDEGPDQIEFTEAFASTSAQPARLRSVWSASTRRSPTRLNQIPRRAERARGRASKESVADVIVPAGKENRLLRREPGRSGYLLSEGMAAPMGSLQNYRRDPRAVMVDRPLACAR